MSSFSAYTKSIEIGKAKRAVVQIIMVMDGEVWVDDVVLSVEK